MLALDIEFLTGKIVAARPERNEQLDWPPQPDRVFSALVATWGARGERSEEREALEWLEAQNPPKIIHGECAARTAPTVYVPPNDFKTSKSGFDVIPSLRNRQARRFIAGRLVDGETTVRLVWGAEPEESLRRALESLAHDTSYVGHSSSLTRCYFTTGSYDLVDAMDPKRRVYVGRLAELEHAFKTGRRPPPGAVVQRSYRVASQGSAFSQDWIVFRTAPGGTAPDLRAFPHVARKIRDSLIVGYSNAVGVPPEWLSGHRPDRSPTCAPHVAIVPLANVGWGEYSTGGLLGCAVVLPKNESQASVDALNQAIAERLQHDNRGGADGHGIIEVSDRTFRWRLQPTVSAVEKSMSPERWFGLSAKAGRAAARWHTATPIALDRFPKEKTIEGLRAEIGDAIAVACLNSGLPRPTDVAFSDVSAVLGAEPVLRGREVLPWQRWQLPRSLRGRFLVHASLVFPEAVPGPVILGAGRFVGLGLCLPARGGL